MRKNLLLIVLFAIVTISISYTSCTYDYFEDEINYIVYVPEVVDKTVRDCRVMVFDEAGTLMGEKYGVAPFDRDPRIKIGQFGFRLAPGDYKVYCYTNTDSLDFTETRTLDETSFKMKLKENSENYMQPGDMFFQTMKHTVIHPAFLSVDTANVKRYTGRITVRFKNFPDDATKIEKVHLLANGIGTQQILKYDTLTTRVSETDAMTHWSVPVVTDANTFEVDNRFFPSIENELSIFNFNFCDANENSVTNNIGRIDIIDNINSIDRTPVRLLHGRRVIVEVDTWTVVKVSIVGWDEDVYEEDINMQ